MGKCDYCEKDYEAEKQLIVLDGITERSTICPYCGYKNIIDYYDEDLNELVELANARSSWLKSLNRDPEEDNTMVNLVKRINNLSPYLLISAKRRSQGRPCYVHTAEFILTEEETV